MGNSQPTADASSCSRLLPPKRLDDLRQQLPVVASEIDDLESKEACLLTWSEKHRLKTLKEIAYDAEDAIADWDADGGEIDGGMMKRIEAIFTKLGEERKMKKALKLREADGKKRKAAEPPGRQETGPLPCESKIYGRDREIKLIIEDITEKDRERFIYTVLGAAGVGKTTLVQHVRDHDTIKNRFRRFGWVSVRGDFDELALTKALYESLTEKPSSCVELQEAQDELRRELRGQKCFLVLDDVWNAGQEFWSRFWEPLAPDLKESVVFVVTRSMLVEESMPEKLVVEKHTILKPLEGDASSELFWSKVSAEGRRRASEAKSQEAINRCWGIPSRLIRAGRGFPDRDGLEGDVSDIAASYRCLRAPLKRCVAYCTLFPEGHIISKDLLVRLWMAEGFVEASDEKGLEEKGEEYFEELCYRSFLLYHDGFQFRMVQNDLPFEMCSRIIYGDSNQHPTASTRHLSYVVDGRDKVEWRPIAGGARTPSLRTFIVCPRIDQNKGELSHLKIDLSALPRLQYLRVLDLSYTKLEELPKAVMEHSRHLRFLGLNGTKIRCLPESMCTSFPKLQTLELENCSRLEGLPQGMGRMTELRHLVMGSATKLCMPTGLGDLDGLRTLQIFNVGRAEGFAGIRELKNLTKLTGELCISGLCNVADSFDCEEADLASKTNINGKLTLAWPPPPPPDHYMDEEEFNDSEDGRGSSDESDGEGESSSSRNGTNLMSVDNATESTQEARKSITNPISRFMLEKDNDNTIHFMHETASDKVVNSSLRDVPQDDGHKNQVFEKLRPHDNLKILVVKSYDGTVFPEWIANDSFKVKTLLLEDCKGCLTLPALGVLPSLENLVINRMPVEGIGSEFCPESSFPKLEVLRFSELYELCSWTDVKENDFPKLTTFDCFNCPKLGLIPNFVSLKTLEVENCGALESLPILPNLETLRIVACDSLKELPNLPNLRDLKVSYCAALEILPDLPSLEEKLWLEDCDNLKCVGFLGKTSLERKDMIKCFSTFYVVNCPHLGFSAWKTEENDVFKLTYVDDKGIIKETLSRN